MRNNNTNYDEEDQNNPEGGDQYDSNGYEDPNQNDSEVPTEQSEPVKKPIGERFKEKWNEEDEHCQHCGAVTKYSKGLTRQSMKRLFSFKASVSDWITLFIIVMVIFMAWAYSHDVKQCRDLIKNIDSICFQYNRNLISNSSSLNNPLIIPTNITEANVTNEPSTEPSLATLPSEANVTNATEEQINKSVNDTTAINVTLTNVSIAKQTQNST